MDRFSTLLARYHIQGRGALPLRLQTIYMVSSYLLMLWLLGYTPLTDVIKALTIFEDDALKEPRVPRSKFSDN